MDTNKAMEYPSGNRIGGKFSLLVWYIFFCSLSAYLILYSSKLLINRHNVITNSSASTRCRFFAKNEEAITSGHRSPDF